MGRIKDKLLDSEYKDMNLNGNENISEYLLTINASESDGLYHIEYCIMDLRKLESVKITEKINESDLNNLIDPTLWKILYQNEYGLYSKITYKTLCNDVFTDDKYLFQAIALQKPLTSLNQLLIIPDTDGMNAYYLRKIFNKLEGIETEIAEHRLSNDDNLQKIGNFMDSINYIIQH